MNTLCANLKIEARWSNHLHTGKVTVSSIFEHNFLPKTFPLFHSAYKPHSPFVILPPLWLKELDLEAEYDDLIEEIVYIPDLTYSEKRKIYGDMNSKQYESKKKIQTKGGDKYATR